MTPAPPEANTAKEGASPRDELAQWLGAAFASSSPLATSSRPVRRPKALHHCLHRCRLRRCTRCCTRTQRTRPAPHNHSPTAFVSLRLPRTRPPSLCFCAYTHPTPLGNRLQPRRFVAPACRAFGLLFPSTLPAQVAERSFIYPRCGQVYWPYNILSIYISMPVHIPTLNRHCILTQRPPTVSFDYRSRIAQVLRAWPMS
ncbi:hypothetical protein C8Q78DRAFT_594678 [Trametes maxima]|nr:hypothetical protein C8Q78DRAFT_594678 [Trametes maxima]